MEYLYYLLSVLAIVAICLYAIRLPGRNRLAGRPVELADRARRRRERQEEAARREAEMLKRRKEVLQRELQSVPTPWGWPGSELHRLAAEEIQDDYGSSFRRWVDALMREKRTVDSEEYLAHRQACVRALLEDRFGRSVQTTAIEYSKVVPPRLRDPDMPHDQQDNFPSGRTEQIVAKLAREPASLSSARVRTKPGTPLREIRKPWGW